MKQKFVTDRIIREPECYRVTGLSRTTRWRLEYRDEFPQRIRLSAGCTGWLLSEVEEWLAARKTMRSELAA